MKKLAMFLCLLGGGVSLCHAQVPQAHMALNGTTFVRGDYLSAAFQLNNSITRPFTVFAVVIMPNGSMLDALTLEPNLKPMVSNYPTLNAPFSYPLMSLKLPSRASLGQYEVVAAFFDPSKPIAGRADAFLDVSVKFEVENAWYLIYGPNGSGDVVRIGLMYVACNKDGEGCATGETMNWRNAVSWASGLNWLGKNDWRLPRGGGGYVEQGSDEIVNICDVKNSIPGFTWQYGEYYSQSDYWSSTSDSEDHNWAWGGVFGSSQCSLFLAHKSEKNHVRAVRDAE